MDKRYQIIVLIVVLSPSIDGNIISCLPVQYSISEGMCVGDYAINVCAPNQEMANLNALQLAYDFSRRYDGNTTPTQCSFFDCNEYEMQVSDFLPFCNINCLRRNILKGSSRNVLSCQLRG